MSLQPPLAVSWQVEGLWVRLGGRGHARTETFLSIRSKPRETWRGRMSGRRRVCQKHRCITVKRMFRESSSWLTSTRRCPPPLVATRWVAGMTGAWRSYIPAMTSLPKSEYIDYPRNVGEIGQGCRVVDLAQVNKPPALGGVRPIGTDSPRT